MLKGREVILLRGDALVVKRDLLGLGRAREYDLQHTKHLRMQPSVWNPFDRGGMPLWGSGQGHIAFDYGSETVRCASAVDEAEAGEIVRELKAEHAFRGGAWSRRYLRA
ncbi:MAG: hypothetical protein DMF86_16525 [Acidobacteria bacterium]|nr:MAG: hypothetical protein DMF86_16525 [Acidobacteriota bacterium]